MRRLLVAALAALATLVPRLAAAEPHKLLVLQSEGRADAGLRAKIDAAITRLATAADPGAATASLTFTDAATAVGCKPEATACKDEVLGMLAVDEIVITTVTPRPGGVEIAVRRVGRGAEHDATMLLASGAPPDKLDGIAPLFGGKPAPFIGPPIKPASPGRPLGPPPDPNPAPPAPAIDTAPPVSEPVIPPPTAVVPPQPPVPERAPAPLFDRISRQSQSDERNHRLQLAGMAGGGGMVVIGLVLWGAANGVQSDINNAPNRTRQDLLDLRDLESRGDTYAALGNVLVLGGAVVGGVATYFYLRDRRAASTATARLVPTVLDHGAGLVLTIGGMP
jgi:hypothetical protein